MENSLGQLISEGRLAAVKDALMTSFGSSAVDQIELLSGGLSGSAVYKIFVNGDVYVLKLDAASEKGKPALVHASAAGIAPKLYYLEPSNGITITEFVEGKPIRGAMEPGRLMAELATAVRSIHSIAAVIPGRGMLESFEGIKANFLSAGILSGPVVDECFKRFEVVRSAYPWNDPDKVFSHNDINPGNLLWDGTRLLVIDWDTAFSNDRYLDLATVANFFAYTDELEMALLRGYFGDALDEYKHARFFVMRQISRVIYSMLLTQVAMLSAPAGQVLDPSMEGATLKAFGELMGAGKLSMTSYEGQLMYGKAQMNEAVRQMRTERFAEAVERL